MCRASTALLMRRPSGTRLHLDSSPSCCSGEADIGVLLTPGVGSMSVTCTNQNRGNYSYAVVYADSKAGLATSTSSCPMGADGTAECSTGLMPHQTYFFQCTASRAGSPNRSASNSART